MSAADISGWQVGAPGYPVLDVDYNETDAEGLLVAGVGPWRVEVGDRVCVEDADGLAFWARVSGPRFGREYVGVEVEAAIKRAVAAPGDDSSESVA